jgi:hypothetical protein
MTNPDYTAICLVIDRSGSMRNVQDDAQGAINAFLDDQRNATGKRTVRLVQFDDRYEVAFPSTPAAEVTEFVLHPRGLTALLDAIGHGITEFGEELAALPEDERPGNVVFAIMTDGYENSSREWKLDQVKELVQQQQDQWGWNIAYLGADQDAIAQGAKLGMSNWSSMTYVSHNTRAATEALSGYVASSAAGGRAAFTEDDRVAQKDKR